MITEYDIRNYTLDRNDAPEALYELYASGEDISDLGSLVADVYSGAEFPLRCLDYDQWLIMFEDGGYTHNGMSADKPTQAVTLYRGADDENKVGMSWSPDLVVAQWFANRFDGKVWKYTFEPLQLLAYIDNHRPGESEYIVSTDWINSADVIELKTS